MTYAGSEFQTNGAAHRYIMGYIMSFGFLECLYIYWLM